MLGMLLGRRVGEASKVGVRVQRGGGLKRASRGEAGLGVCLIHVVTSANGIELMMSPADGNDVFS